MKRKLLFAMLCIVSALGMNAQTWTSSEPAEGDFYLYNVGAAGYLVGANNWGTRASISATGGISVTLAGSGTDYTLSTAPTYSGKYLGNNGFVDGASDTWTFTAVEGETNVYKMTCPAGTLFADAGATTCSVGADPGTNYAYWKLVSKDNRTADLANATENSGIDATYFLLNPNFSRNANQSGWIMESSNKNLCGGKDENRCAESWCAAFTLSQEITVPNGIYELTAQAAVTEYTVTGADLPVVYANDVNTPFTAMTEGENSMAGLSANFTAGKYVVGPIRVVVTNGSLTIGVRGTRTDTWCVWDNFKLTYKGVDLNALRDALQAQIDAVPALEGKTTTAAYNAAKSYADGINVSSLTTEEAISDASVELANRVNAAKALQTDYARYNDIKTSAKGIATSLDTTTPDAALDAATTNDAAIAAIAALRAAFLAELPNVEIPADPGFIDVTAVMVDNAGVHTNTDYWTKGGTPNGGYSFGVCNYGECEFYNCNFKFYQTLALTPGTWEFGVTGFHRAGNHNTHFYAGEDKILIPGVANTVVNSMAEAQTYFNNGNGLVALKFLIETAGNVEIGIDNQDTETDKWTIFRDFTLKYYGAPDYTIYDQQWSDAVTAANEALEAQAYKNVSGSERTAVTNAIADAPAGSSKANYLEKIQTLEAATATFKAAAPSYDAYAAYKAETIALWATDFEVKAPTTAAEAVNAVAQLNVAQYNNVKDNYTYSLDGLIGDFGTWTGTATVAGEPAEPNYLDWEHWSGTQHAYYEQAAAGWGNANGWTIKYEKTCKLPAGNYVLKVAARSSAGTTSKVSCSAIATTISLPCAGNSTRGINTSGAASWSDDDTFAHTGDYKSNPATVGGTGAGWQWRFLPFKLDKDTEVTMTFEAEASTQYQWMSIGDAVLLSDDDPAEEVDYNDDEDNTIESALIANVTVNREIKADFNTVVLPFNVTAVQVTEIFGEGTKVYNFSENSDNAETAEIQFQSGDGSITANVPVLVKATKASSAQEFKGVVVAEPTSDIKVAGKFIDFVGTYAPVDVAEGDYFVGNGALYRSEGNTSMKAFRAFLKVKSAEVKAELFIDGVATAIESINGNVAQPAGAIYNLAGQRVQKAQRGLYIVNGKKIVVK